MPLTAKILIYVALMAIGIAVLVLLYIRDARRLKKQKMSFETAKNKEET